MPGRLFSGQVRTKCDRWFGVGGDVDLAQLFVARQVAADAAQRGFFLGVGEIEPGNLLGAFEHLFAKPRRRAAALSDADAWQRDAGGDRGRNRFEEPSASNVRGRVFHDGLSNTKPDKIT